MLKYLLRNLVLSSLIILSVGGCTPVAYRNFKKVPGAEDSMVVVRPWFRSNDDHFLFHSGIDVFRNHFTGLMVIKPLEKGSHRVIFINEVGIKIFDMEFPGTGDYIVHYCLEYLNKKLFIKTLKNDISLMLNNQTGTWLKTFSDNKTGSKVLKYRDSGGVKYMLIRKNSDAAEEIIQSRCPGKKVRISYYSQNGNEPDSVIISHFNIKLDIHLSKINENK